MGRAKCISIVTYRLENYTDWISYPSAVNTQPFGVRAANSSMDLMANIPEYYTVISNGTNTTLDVRVKNNTATTSRFVSREFKIVPHYGILISLDTKDNTKYISNIDVSSERSNEEYNRVSMIIEISIFVVLIIGCICIGFEHSDIRLKKWMMPNRVLLRLSILQIFASPVISYLFTLFEQEFSTGLLLGSNIMNILIDIQHFSYWIDSFTFENVCIE